MLCNAFQALRLPLVLCDVIGAVAKFMVRVPSRLLSVLQHELLCQVSESGGPRGMLFDHPRGMLLITRMDRLQP
jgi:hypothetical protein